MAVPALKPCATLADYERVEAESPLRHEFYDGEIFVMAGGRQNHSRLCARVLRELGNALAGGPCEAFTSGCRVMSPAETDFESDHFAFPDVSVACGEAQWGPPADTLLNPAAIVEVLSSSTEAYDRGAKFRFYRRIPSLHTVVFVASERLGVEVFERQDDGAWRMTEPVGDAVELRALGVTLALAALYDGVALDPHASLHPSADPV